MTLTYSAVKLERELQRTGRGRASAAARQLEAMFDVLVAGDGELAILHALQPNAPKFLDGDDHKGPLFMSDAIYDASPSAIASFGRSCELSLQYRGSSRDKPDRAIRLSVQLWLLRRPQLEELTRHSFEIDGVDRE